MCQNFNAFDLLVMAERRYGEPEFMLTRNLWYDTFDKLKIDKKPTIQELEEFFSQQPYDFSTIFHSLKLKYRALTTELLRQPCHYISYMHLAVHFGRVN